MVSVRFSGTKIITKTTPQRLLRYLSQIMTMCARNDVKTIRGRGFCDMIVTVRFSDIKKIIKYVKMSVILVLFIFL